VRAGALSRPALGAWTGCRFPDAILRGNRSCRPRSRAVQRLAVTEFLSEASQLARLVVAPPAGEPGKDALMGPSAHLCGCSRSATAVSGALARRYGSGLLALRLRSLHDPAVPFGGIAGGRKHGGRCQGRLLPGTKDLLSRLSAPLMQASFLPARILRARWSTVATIYPWVTVIHRGWKPSIGYFTRLGPVSRRSLPRTSSTQLWLACDRGQKKW
jgi:hypothetical protein